ncbi:hypothetical protein J4E05_09210 [Thalassospira sp. NFXS8]
MVIFDFIVSLQKNLEEFGMAKVFVVGVLNARYDKPRHEGAGFARI